MLPGKQSNWSLKAQVEFQVQQFRKAKLTYHVIQYGCNLSLFENYVHKMYNYIYAMSVRINDETGYFF